MKDYHKILIVSNMIPDKKHPSYGVFVKNFIEQMEHLHLPFDVSAMYMSDGKLSKLLGYIRFYMKTYKSILSGKYDLVYVHYPSFSFIPVNAARLVRRFDIMTNLHGSDVIPLKRIHKIMNLNTAAAVKKSVKVVVPSEYYKSVVLKKYGIPQNRICVYPSAGIDTDVFHPLPEDGLRKLREEYGIDEDAFVIGFAGRLVTTKGWKVLLRALVRSDKLKNSGFRVLIVGDGVDGDKLDNAIEKMPAYIRENIIRYPFLDQKKLAEVYNLMDVLAFPTLANESLGLVALEAMTTGVPVISSDIAAPSYYIKDGVNGYKFEVGNADRLAECIDRCISDPEKHKSLKTGALNTAQKYSSTEAENILGKLFIPGR